MKMIKKSTFKRIKRKYGPFSSFAIWDKKEKDYWTIPDFEKDHLKELHTDIIILALNPSEKTRETESFKSFHYKGKKDWLLKKAFNKKPFYGAYMTDVLHEIEQDSSKINTKSSETNNLDSLKKELKEIAGKKTKLIVMGQKAQKLLKRRFKPDKKTNSFHISNKTFTVLPITHFCCWGTAKFLKDIEKIKSKI